MCLCSPATFRCFHMKTVQRLLDHHRASPAAATVLTAVLQDATGYGRILRAGGTGDVTGIVEHKDATEEQRAIREINSGIYVFDSRASVRGTSGTSRRTTYRKSTI